MRKRVLVLLMLLLVLLLGCQRDGGEDLENIFLDKEGAVDVNIGSELSSSVISGGSFFVRANVRNNGWPKIKMGEMSFYLLGVDPVDFGVKRAEGGSLLVCDLCRNSDGGEKQICPCIKNNFELRGRGGGASFGFKLTSPNVPLASDQSISIITRACYPYYTVSQSRICVGRPVFGGVSGCEFSSTFDVKNTIAPYHITSLRQYFDEGGGGKMVVEMGVNKVLVGVGSSYLPVDAECTDSVKFGLLERVRVAAIIIGNDVYISKGECQESEKIDGKCPDEIRIGRVLEQISPNINVGAALDLMDEGSGIKFEDFSKAFICEERGLELEKCPDEKKKEIIVVDIYPGEDGVLLFDYSPPGGIPAGKQIENLVVLLEYGFYTQDSRSVTVLAR